MKDSGRSVFNFLLLSLTACNLGTSPLDAGYYACSDDSHCAPDYACNLATGFCTLGSTGDTTPAPGTDGTDTPDSTCGNGTLDEGETCDDGNCDDDDGCLANCLIESEDSFISIWQTIDDGDTVTVPLRENWCNESGHCGTFNYSFTVDWGDGSDTAVVSAHDDPNITHAYATAGEYTITIDGLMETICFNNINPARIQIRSIPNLGNMGWINLESAFKGCNPLTTVAGGDTSEVTDIHDVRGFKHG